MDETNNQLKRFTKAELDTAIMCVTACKNESISHLKKIFCVIIILGVSSIYPPNLVEWLGVSEGVMDATRLAIFCLLTVSIFSAVTTRKIIQHFESKLSVLEIIVVNTSVNEPISKHTNNSTKLS
ncbi:hypothetical protein [Pseudoalteromonas sp. SR45-4]|uniref:hypothetical protein n=1 Tax=Pseudoalteromonas sp. SR45-4 TaxID=2760929 RepID=UPI0015FCB88E|nr:hypothetical protein [Pseudoalteromonas sp. SR45-4]MBB1371249.1 hypothetical protein [Pseudoalteromonas sp. SR45-4]